MAVTCALQALSILAQSILAQGDNSEKQTYDLVLAEVHMPQMDGFNLVQHVHRDFNVPVIRKSLYIHNFSLKLTQYINYIY